MKYLLVNGIVIADIAH